MLKGHKLVSEDQKAYTIEHPNGTRFQVAKAPLSGAMHGIIAKMPKVEHEADGGDSDDNSLLNALVPPSHEMGSNTAPSPESDTTVAPPEPAPAPSAPTPGPDAQVGDQTYPTPDGLPPADPSAPAPSSAPAPTAPAGPSMDYLDKYLKDSGKALDTQQAGVNAEAKAKGAQGTAEAAAGQQLQTANDASIQTYQAERQRLDQQNQQLFDAVANGKVDPNHIWGAGGAYGSTGSKITLLASILIGGAGMRGGRSNAAMDVINKAVDQDIDAQKTNLNNKTTLLGLNLQRSRDLTAAQNETRLQLLTTFQAQLQQAAGKAAGPIAQAQAQQIIGGIQAQRAQLAESVAQQRAMWAYSQGLMGAAGAPAQGDPNDVNMSRMQALQIAGERGLPGGIPKEEGKDVNKELGLFNRQKDINATLQQNFDVMQKNLGGGPEAGLLTSNTRRQFEAAANVVGSTVDHELAGRVTDTTLNELKAHNLPAWGDSPATLARKRNIIMDAVKAANSKDAEGYGTLIRHGLISPDNPHITGSATLQKRFKPGK